MVRGWSNEREDGRGPMAGCDESRRLCITTGTISIVGREKNHDCCSNVFDPRTGRVVLVHKNEEERVGNSSRWFGCLVRTERISERGVGRRTKAPRKLKREMRLHILGGASPSD
jgi:hypothetical protein